MVKNIAFVLLAAIVIAAIAAIALIGGEQSPVSGPSYGWTITSYSTIKEELYAGGKAEVFDAGGNSLGFYKRDFLEQLRIDGAGLGDGNRNSGKILHYDYGVDDGETCYLTDISLGAYGNELVPWTGERPSVAVNPPVPFGTTIRFTDLGPDAEKLTGWVSALLEAKTFHADDQFFLEPESRGEKKIDIYTGLETTRDPSSPEYLLLRNATIYIEYP